MGLHPSAKVSLAAVHFMPNLPPLQKHHTNLGPTDQIGHSFMGVICCVTVVLLVFIFYLWFHVNNMTFLTRVGVYHVFNVISRASIQLKSQDDYNVCY